MDEEWFYALLIRIVLKSTKMIGIDTEMINVKNIKHIHKILTIVITVLFTNDKNTKK